MITRVRSCLHAYVHVFDNNPSPDLSQFENRRKLSIGNIRCMFFEKFRQLIGNVRIHTRKIPLPLTCDLGPKPTLSFTFIMTEIPVLFPYNAS